MLAHEMHYCRLSLIAQAARLMAGGPEPASGRAPAAGLPESVVADCVPAAATVFDVYRGRVHVASRRQDSRDLPFSTVTGDNR